MMNKPKLLILSCSILLYELCKKYKYYAGNAVFQQEAQVLKRRFFFIRGEKQKANKQIHDNLEITHKFQLLCNA